MEAFSDPVFLARLQFAVTTMFHILFPALTIGLSILLVILEILWLRTGDIDYYRHARFWTRFFILGFGIGVVTGIPLEFEFGTNWSRFSTVSGDFFGNILGFEGAMAFMLEAGFLGIMVFGWNRVPPWIHAFATIMVTLGASLSAFWIMVANSWMQTPAGGAIIDGRFVVESYFDAIFNPNAFWGVSHMWMACIETSLFVFGGLSAWYILRGVHVEFFLKSFRLAVLGAIIAAPIQIYLGDGSGASVFEYQPAKGAALEGHWETNPPGTPAAWSIIAWPDKEAQDNLWSIEIPYGLSLLATNTLNGQVLGLREFPIEDQPPALPLLYYSFRVMVVIGFFFFFLMLATVWIWRKGGLRADRISNHRTLLRFWVASMPLGFVAIEMGWIVREVGRQPWVIYGLLRTSDGASTLPSEAVGMTLLAFGIVYPALVFAFIVYAIRLVKKGPDMTVTPKGPRRDVTVGPP